MSDLTVALRLVVLLQMRTRYRQTSVSHVHDSCVEEMLSAMTAAERRLPGIVDSFVSELINSLLSSSLQSTAVDTAIQRTKRYVIDNC